MITLDFTDTVLSGAAALEAGSIQAMQRGYAGGCSYRDDSGIPCLIGAAIKTEDWERDIGRGGRNDEKIETLVSKGIVKIEVGDLAIDESEAVTTLQALQDAHDQVLHADDPFTRKNAVRRLKRRVASTLTALEKGGLPKFIKEL